MKFSASKGARSLTLVALVASVSACGLPRAGPNKQEIYAGSVLKQGDAFIVTVNSRVTQATSVVPAFGFGSNFRNAGLIGSD
ncbi:MAG: polysaccharide export protein, partial [Paracoccaceae bacterium]|nr:polysaccharide export protein [Paracoccaceae bacterium]